MDTAPIQPKAYTLSEQYPAIQGEGTRVGDLVTFIRLGGCNLSCPWCDTPYSIESNGDYYDAWTHNIVEALDPNRNVVITGGEPLLQDIGPLVMEIKTRRPKMHITVETNGTKAPSGLALQHVDLFSISPKGRNAGYKIPIKALGKWIRTFDANIQWKHVVRDATDVLEVNEAWMEMENRWPKQLYTRRVLGEVTILQPESTSDPKGFTKALALEFKWDGRWARRNLRIVPQVHFLIWGPKRGI